MPSVILSRPSSATDKVLRRSEFSRERNGLEALEETYTIRSSARLTVAPARDTLHSAYSSAATLHTRMSVDGVSFREIDGDLAEMVVTYVGLTSASGLPPALVRLVPTVGAGVFGPPAVVEVEFVSDSSEADLMRGGFTSAVSPRAEYWSTRRIPIPPSINGTALPPSPRANFFRDGIGTSANYEGYVMDSLEFTRRGRLAIVRITFKEYYAVTVSGSWSAFGGNPIKPAISWGKGSS